jgi:hypothetical protein
VTFRRKVQNAKHRFGTATLWSGRRDMNPGHLDSQTSASSTEASHFTPADQGCPPVYLDLHDIRSGDVHHFQPMNSSNTVEEGRSRLRE